VVKKIMYDVAIIGSGPAGAVAALDLARQGIKVILVEKASLPRYKTCGGGIVHRAARLLPVDIRTAVERECYSAQLNILDTDLHFSTTRKQPIVSMSMRDKFDFLLVSAAAEAGAEIQTECELLDLVTQADGVRLVTKERSLKARFVIAADGAMSTVARKAGWPETRHLIPALEYEVRVDSDTLNRFGLMARFDFGIVPYGYGWVFPKKEHLSIGVLSMRRHSINLGEIFQNYLKVIGIGKIESMERHGFIIPVRPRRGDMARGRILLTGDAAGLADPVTGEGITYAIQSGLLAARALIDSNFDEALVGRAYHLQLGKKILPELRLGRMLARLLYNHPRLRAWVFRRYGQRLSEAVTDLVMGERTYQEILMRVLTTKTQRHKEKL
jgi:geranylgeranyl reductase family protein